LGFQAFVPTLTNLLAEARAQVGRLAEAQALLDEVPAVPRGGTYTSRPLALLLLGLVADARELVATAISDAREHGERGTEAWLLWLMGEIAARESDADTAAIRFRESLALADVLRMRPLVAHCHLGLGRLHRLAGRVQEARDHFSTATTMYREMDMRFYLEQAEAELREVA
jgi:tetratricopeptide (TPR) repeat protein